MSNDTNSWSDGYVTDVEYTFGFYRELSPVYLNYILASHSHEPIDLTQKFTYCELGCGNGFSTNIIASTLPKGEFYGVDFNPTHISNATSIAREGNLNNVTFLEESFESLLNYDLPNFDFICLHGVWSWISKSNRDHVIEFITKKLKPGGCVYNSYNCLPGWSMSMPLRHLMVSFAEEHSGSTQQKITKSIESVRKAFDQNFGYFGGNQAFGRTLSTVEKANKNYVAHEYFNKDWSPFYSSEVAGDFDKAKLSFVGTTHIVDSMSALTFPENVVKILNETSSSTLRETLKDYYSNTTFRKDVFTKGAPRISTAKQAHLMRNTKFALSVPRPKVADHMMLPKGKAEFPELYTRIFDKLAEKPCTIDELSELSTNTTPQGSLQIMVEAMAIMCSLGNVSPVNPEAESTNASTLNKSILERCQTDTNLSFLASPITACGIHLSWLQLIFFEAIAAGLGKKECLEKAFQQMAVNKQGFQSDGKVVIEKEEIFKRLEDAYNDFMEVSKPFVKYSHILD